MYQIILLVLLAPVLYLFLKNIWTGAAFLLVLLVALFMCGAAGAELDALIYYSFPPMRRCTEKMGGGGMVVERAALGMPAGSGNRAQQEPIIPTHFVPGIVLYQLRQSSVSG